jgi:hypothetical protein
MPQTRVPVNFAPGASSASMTGAVTGHDYVDCTLGARKGQTMSVKLTVTGTNGDGVFYFNILPPGSDDVAIFNGSDGAVGRSGTVTLRECGGYTIRVYLMGDDEATGKHVDYRLDAAIR